MILAGDVGGTKVHLALYEFANGRLKPVRDHKYPAHDFATLDEIVNDFFKDDDASRKQVVAACFGCPGPVKNGRLKLTNLPWTLDSRDLQASLKIEHIFLINDLEANGYGIPELAPESIFTLHQADPTSVGHRGLVSAGTGLGEALLIWDGDKRHTPIPSEGGHVDFAPRDDQEIALLQYLRRTLNGRVSTERVVSGIGIKNVYAFLKDDQKIEEPAWLRERMEHEDPNAVIGQSAEDGSSELCAETLRIFAGSYGAEAGNVALKILAAGGIYLGGGIAPKILKTLQNGVFMKAFVDKGRMEGILQGIPVRIILDDTCALLGAAGYAEIRAGEISGHSERAASVLATS
ncbi:glucokinase [Granulicella sibirica]|uniref:Glucokinase n=1 Tax=Granulicella sibirica TaxID=2479048 RepID=A0A4V1L641_9BACT|nr:glucokinase [Granulicella sibirica]RXH57944.1 Glucokinase [Granulicella sibirica]